MATMLTDLQVFLDQTADERTNDWPMVRNPVSLIIITMGYLYLVLKWGPNYMRKREPYQLTLVISLYNVGQVLGCAYVVRELLVSGWWQDYSLGCQPIDTSNSPKALRMAAITWWTVLLKLSEYLETIFFVLRKKQRQVTTLHVYHHVSSLVLAWLCVKYAPGGMTTFAILINCVVHILMYSYYLISIHASTQLQKKLNHWKRYLTIIQMVQFCIVIGHGFQGFAPSCNINRIVVYALVPNVFLIFYMFYNFYKKSYKKIKST